MPNESTIRINYVSQCYENTTIKIRQYTQNENIWICIDETTDVANVIIGTLEIDKSGKVFLLNSDVLEKTKYSTIVKLFDRTLSVLWPTGIQYDRITFSSDVAPYIQVKAGQSISAF